MKISKKFNTLTLTEYRHYIKNHDKYTDFNPLALYRSILENPHLDTAGQQEVLTLAKQHFQKFYDFLIVKDINTYARLTRLGQAPLTSAQEWQYHEQLRAQALKILAHKKIRNWRVGIYTTSERYTGAQDENGNWLTTDIMTRRRSRKNAENRAHPPQTCAQTARTPHPPNLAGRRRNMNHPLIHPRQQTTLRHDLRKAGCVFEFAAWQWQARHEPTADEHKTALVALFEQLIIPEYREQQEKALCYYDSEIPRTQNPAKRKTLQKQRQQTAAYHITLNISAARSVKLDNRQLLAPEKLRPYQSYTQLNEQEWFINLYHAFQDPPYGLSIEDSERLPLWQRFCATIGLNAQDQPQIFDWLRHQIYPRQKQTCQCHPLSNYFDAGLEWWGVWCLTLYNPHRQTLAAVAASATD